MKIIKPGPTATNLIGLPWWANEMTDPEEASKWWGVIETSGIRDYHIFLREEILFSSLPSWRELCDWKSSLQNFQSPLCSQSPEVWQLCRVDGLPATLWWSCWIGVRWPLGQRSAACPSWQPLAIRCSSQWKDRFESLMSPEDSESLHSELTDLVLPSVVLLTNCVILGCFSTKGGCQIRRPFRST